MFTWYQYSQVKCLWIRKETTSVQESQRMANWNKMQDAYLFSIQGALLSGFPQWINWRGIDNGLYRRPSHQYPKEGNHRKCFFLFIWWCPIILYSSQMYWKGSEIVRSPGSCFYYCIHNLDKAPFCILVLPIKQEEQVSFFTFFTALFRHHIR